MGLGERKGKGPGGVCGGRGQEERKPGAGGSGGGGQEEEAEDGEQGRLQGLRHSERRGARRLCQAQGTHERTSGPGLLTRVWLGGFPDRVRAAEAHELRAAPQRLPQGPGLLAEAPLALPEARQAQHPQRRRGSHDARPRASGTGSGSPTRAGGGTMPAKPRPERRRCRDNGEGPGAPRTDAATCEARASQRAGGSASSSPQLQLPQVAAGVGRPDRSCCT